MCGQAFDACVLKYVCVCVHSDREHHCIVIWWWWRWWYECEVKTAEVLFFLRINDCGSLLFHNLVIYKKLFASMNFLHSTYCITSGVWIWLTVVQLLCYLQLFNSHVTYSCSTLMLLTPIMWCFLGSDGTLNILHQYSVSMVFGTVNCGQNETHDQAGMWRKYPISDLEERCSLKLHLRAQLREMSIILKYCIIFRHGKLRKLNLLSASGDTVMCSAVRRFYASDISDGDWNWCLNPMTTGESSVLQRLAEYFVTNSTILCLKISTALVGSSFSEESVLWKT